MILILNTDIREALKNYSDNYFDGFLADAPYEISFMSKKWDGKGIAFSVDLWKEIYRVLKPGAYLLCYGGTRTYHRLTCAIEDAGFEIRDCLMWLYGQGFPKSTDISKQLDKRAGAKREVVGESIIHSRGNNTAFPKRPNETSVEESGRVIEQNKPMITAPATDEAKLFQGYGTALKPAWEPIVMAMKPIEKTYAENALTWGTGGINIDDTRISLKGDYKSKANGRPSLTGLGDNYNPAKANKPDDVGRFPANLLLTHHPDCKVIGLDEWECYPDCPIDQLNKQAGIKKSGKNATRTKVGSFVEHGGLGKPGDKQVTYGDAGFVSRFFYNGKVSKKEREKGLEELELKMQTEEYAGFSMRCKICGKHLVSGGDYCTCDETIYGPKADRMVNPVFHNNHPTLKPILLNQYLARLILPPAGGKLLNPFSGVCSEAIGAFYAGWDEVVSIEKEAEYVSIAEARVKYWTQFNSYEEGLKGKNDEGTKGS